jgi:hypothetical protein
MTAEVETYTYANPDRRHNKRFKSKTRVIVKTKLGKKRDCKAINLSSTGVAIETHNLGLIKGESVTLIFIIDFGKLQKIHRRQAVVKHVTKGVTGFSMEKWLK